MTFSTNVECVRGIVNSLSFLNVDVFKCKHLCSAPLRQNSIDSWERYFAIFNTIIQFHDQFLVNLSHLSLILYFCSWLRTKDAAVPRWLLRWMQSWFLLILWPKEVVNMFLFFWFVPVSLSYDPKREGHPFTEKGIKQ